MFLKRLIYQFIFLSFYLLSNAYGCDSLDDSRFAVKLWISPHYEEHPSLSAVREAKESIRLSTYRLSDPRAHEALEVAAKKGVSVDIIYGKNIYSHNRQVEMERNIEDLRISGIRLHNLSDYFHQIHHKLFIIDCKKAFIGTHDPRRTVSLQYRDFVIEVEDELIIKNLINFFQADIEQKIEIEFLHSSLIWGPYGQREQFIKLFSSAKESIFIYQQDIQDEGIQSSLLRALENKIRVRLIMTPYPFDKEKKEDKNLFFQKRLVGAGGEVGLLMNLYVHAKAFLIDFKHSETEKLYIGSTNFYPECLDHNRELGIIVRDKKAIEEFFNVFEEDWKIAEKLN